MTAEKRAGEMPDVHEDMPALLEVTDVKKSFDTPRGRQEVLRGVSLRLAPGEVCGIVGASGSGKSTLFRIIAGSELPDEPIPICPIISFTLWHASVVTI